MRPAAGSKFREHRIQGSEGPLSREYLGCNGHLNLNSSASWGGPSQLAAVRRLARKEAAGEVSYFVLEHFDGRSATLIAVGVIMDKGALLSLSSTGGFPPFPSSDCPFMCIFCARAPVTYMGVSDLTFGLVLSNRFS